MPESDTITQAFTELAPDYTSAIDRELVQFWGTGYRAFVAKLLQIAAVQPGEKVLDIATGTAVIPETLAAGPNDGRSGNIVGLDITPAMLAQGRREMAACGLLHSARLVCASAMQMPFSAGAFQVALCALGTHHMDVPRMLREARRVLARGGRLVISDVCATPFWRSLAGKAVLGLLLWQYGILHSGARAKAEIEAYQNVRTAREWAGLLYELGFNKVAIHEIRPRYPWYPGGLILTAQVDH